MRARGREREGGRERERERERERKRAREGMCSCTRFFVVYIRRRLMRAKSFVKVIN